MKQLIISVLKYVDETISILKLDQTEKQGDIKR
jgi:hypothetical protein